MPYKLRKFFFASFVFSAFVLGVFFIDDLLIFSQDHIFTLILSCTALILGIIFFVYKRLQFLINLKIDEIQYLGEKQERLNRNLIFAIDEIVESKKQSTNV